jgi:hypothetical protein
MRLRERYVVAMEVIGLAGLVTSIVWALGVIPSVAIGGSVAIIMAAQWIEKE